MRAFLTCCLLGNLVVATCGCTKSADEWPRVPIQGRVTLDGQPLATGQVTLFPIEETKGPAAGAEIQNGEFSIPEELGPVPGKHRVEIRSVQKTGRQVASPSAIEADVVLPAGTLVDEYADVIPTRYNTYSELTVQIDAGKENSLTFPLSSDKNPDKR